MAFDALRVLASLSSGGGPSGNWCTHFVHAKLTGWIGASSGTFGSNAGHRGVGGAGWLGPCGPSAPGGEADAACLTARSAWIGAAFVGRQWGCVWVVRFERVARLLGVDCSGVVDVFGERVGHERIGSEACAGFGLSGWEWITRWIGRYRGG